MTDNSNKPELPELPPQDESQSLLNHSIESVLILFFTLKIFHK